MEAFRQSGNQRSFTDIVADLFTQYTALMRNEAELARTEITEGVAGIGRGLGMMVGGAVLLIPALVILLEAAVAGLSQGAGLASYWSALIIGGAVLILGGILLSVGINRMNIKQAMPSRTVHQLRRDLSTAKEQVSQNHESRSAA